jgi:hypothetical protein
MPTLGCAWPCFEIERGRAAVLAATLNTPVAVAFAFDVVAANGAADEPGIVFAGALVSVARFAAA